MKLLRLAAVLALTLPGLAGCYSDQPLNPPLLPFTGSLMARYVAMGNSITAGFQSAGINDSTQNQSYAVLFARRAGAPFFQPSLQGRGCPPPFTNNVTQARVGGGTAGTCDLRKANSAPYVSNVAVPGARTLELLNNLGVPVSASNALTTFILGGRTQVRAMQDASPTFVTLWIGNNDVLGALTSTTNPGNPLLVTPVPAFQALYGELLDSISATGAKAVLFSVGDVTSIPYASTGTTYWCIKNQPACGFTTPVAFPPTFSVALNCAPGAAVPGQKGDSILVPWPIGIGKLNAAFAGASTTLDCGVDNEVVTPAEYANMRSAVAGYNAYISSQAAARGMGYVDVNAVLAARVADGTIPAFPDLSQALTGGPVRFGTLFTLDGVHPSAAAHRIVADSLTAVTNRVFGTAIR